MWWGFLASVYWARTKPVLNHASTSSYRTTLSTIYKACAGSAEAFFFAPATERIIGEFGASNFLQHILASIALFLFPKADKLLLGKCDFNFDISEILNHIPECLTPEP